MDIIRKAVYMGLGAISMTKDKAEELVDDLIKRGEVASAERFKTIDKLLKEADKQEKEFQRKVSAAVQKVIVEMGLPTRKDLEEIGETLKKIEAKMSSPEKKDAG
jgi:polyhydroxyalkanoate synthesis regulator phasin